MKNIKLLFIFTIMILVFSTDAVFAQGGNEQPDMTMLFHSYFAQIMLGS